MIVTPLKDELLELIELVLEERLLTLDSDVDILVVAELVLAVLLLTAKLLFALLLDDPPPPQADKIIALVINGKIIFFEERHVGYETEIFFIFIFPAFGEC
jgi:hypothetical protein